MKRKLFSSVLCLVLLLVMLLGTTLAWFTDNASNTNTMVSGKISIEQTEIGSDGESFKNNHFVMMPDQEIVKKVSVTNTGNQDCYVRTLFAFEDKEYTDENGESKTVLEMIQANTPTGVEIVPTNVKFTVKNGDNETTFTVGYYVYPVELSFKVDQNTITVLESITLKADATMAWSEAVGTYYEMMILSQASQVTGLGDDAAAALNTAFGAIDENNCAKWFATVLNGSDLYTPNAWEATAEGSVITIAQPENP